MRCIKPKAELKTPQQEGFVFFALTLDEQLFDLTDDSYKAPALNTYSRTLELQNIAYSNHAAGISKDALLPFISELEWSIGKDVALSPEQKNLCRVHIASIRENVSEADRIARGGAGLRISLGKYFKAIQQTILEVIKNQPKNKADLTELASAFIIQAEIFGFPRRHTYHVVNNRFIRKIKYCETLDPIKLLEEFFGDFPVKSGKYESIFIVEGEFDGFQEVLKKFGFSLVDSPPSWGELKDAEKRFLDSKRGGQKYLLVDEVSAVCPAGAHEIVVGMFDEFSAVVRFFEHKPKFSLSSLSLIRNQETKKIYTIRDSPDSMHSWVGNVLSTERDAVELLEVLHSDMHLPEESALRLSRAVRFHRNALLTTSPENQLVDLWAGLEGLLAQPRRESVRIEFFSESLLPALTLGYPEKILTSSYRDVLKAVPAAKPVIASVIGEDSQFSKFVRLILAAEQQKKRDDLIDVLKVNPLILNRVWKVANVFASRNALRESLRRHREKLKWHMARIYFTRNSIMHNASSLPYIKTLVENLHVYVDTLIKSIAKVALVSPEKISIEGTLQYMASWEKFRLDGSSIPGVDNAAPLSENDLWSDVFGREMALAPSQKEEVSLKT